jgi:hypothetical protein
VLFGVNNQDPDQIGYRTGCTDGQAGVSGLRVLFFGTQEAGGKIRPPGTTLTSTAARVDEAAVERASLGWIRGFTRCGSATAVVAIATNNKSDGGVGGSEAGTAWAKLVERVGAATHDGRVTVGGGLDGEPSWSPPDWAHGWVDGFVKTSTRGLYAAASADGCLVGNGESCSHGWTVQDVYYMATGAGPNVYAVPQIYRTDGIQARQWAGISRSAQMTGRAPVRFASALTQQMACKQKPPCDNTDNSPADARDQLGKALADPNILGSSGNVDSSKNSDGSRNSDASKGPDGYTSPDAVLADSKSPGSSAVDASKRPSSNTFGSTDVAWPDDQSALAWVTAQPSLPGGPTG